MTLISQIEHPTFRSMIRVCCFIEFTLKFNQFLKLRVFTALTYNSRTFWPSSIATSTSPDNFLSTISATS